MAEQFGDRPKGRALHHEPRREGVPQVVPGEVLDLCGFERGVEAVLDVLDRLTGFPPAGVGEDVRTVRQALRVESLDRRECRGIQGQGMRTAALGSRNPDDAVQEVDFVPSKIEQTTPPQAGVNRQDDLLR
ncbi:MAG: hypothetical protein NTV05_16040 [Acidobacteria bacterium]|nr:hypothetical protein [Acidobacteriota bacterium]